MSEKVIAFIGQPNTGKSSWINRLSGSSLATGNWSGVTIEKAESWVTFEKETYHLIDLPGIQGLNHQSDEERITEEFIQNQHIDCIVQIMDSCHVESSLSLTLELRKFQIPMVCLLNFEDEAYKYQIHIDCEKLSRRLSIPVISCSAYNHNDTKPIMQWIKKQAHQKVIYRPLLNHDADLVFESLLKWHPMVDAILLFDKQYSELSLNEKHAAVKSCMRYVKGNISQRNVQTLKIDRIILGCFYGKTLLIMLLIVCFAGILTAGSLFSEWIMFGIEFFKNHFFHQINHLPEMLHSYLNDVVLEGIGSLFSFVPMLGGMYIFISVLEECGIMARISLMMDAVMRCFNLTGKSFITFMIAHGCNVPAILHSTSLENEAIRRKTALLVPFCSCTARLPVYFFFIKLMFGNNGMIVCVLLVGLGILSVLALSLFMEQFTAYKIPDPKIIELVPYRMPRLQLILKKTSHHLVHYLSKIATTLLMALSIVWLLNNISIGNATLLVQISKFVSILFVPLGFGTNWIYAAALLPGFIAKEAAAGTFVMLMTMTQAKLSPEIWVNLSYLMFIGLTIPCCITLAAIQNKYGKKMMMTSCLFSFGASYAITWLMVQFIMFF